MKNDHVRQEQNGTVPNKEPNDKPFFRRSSDTHQPLQEPQAGEAIINSRMVLVK